MSKLETDWQFFVSMYSNFLFQIATIEFKYCWQ